MPPRRILRKKPAVEDVQKPVDDSNTPVGQYGEVVALHDDGGETPVSGRSYYIILSSTKARVELFHPFSFTKFTMSMEGYRNSVVRLDWHPNAQRLATLVAEKMEQNARINRENPLWVASLAKHYESLVTL